MFSCYIFWGEIAYEVSYYRAVKGLVKPIMLAEVVLELLLSGVYNSSLNPPGVQAITGTISPTYFSFSSSYSFSITSPERVSLVEFGTSQAILICVRLLLPISIVFIGCGLFSSDAALSF